MYNLFNPYKGKEALATPEWLLLFFELILAESDAI